MRRTTVRMSRGAESRASAQALLADVESAVAKFSEKEDVAYGLHSESDTVVVATFDMDGADARRNAVLADWMEEFALRVAD